MSSATPGPASAGPTRRDLVAGAAAVAGSIGVGSLLRPAAAQAANSGDYFSVTDGAFGATGDGVTNDRAAIQDACDAAAVDGGVVFFPPGVYMVDSTTAISIEDNVQLLGCGRASKVKSSNENTTSVLYVFRCVDSSKVRVSNLWIDGPEAMGSGGDVRLIHHNGDADGALHVEDCYLRKGDTAIKLDSGTVRVVVERCEFTGQASFGLLTSGSSAGDMQIAVRDCWFHDLGETSQDHGVYVPNNHSLDVSGCRFTGISGYGVHVYGQGSGGSHCRIHDCLFDGECHVGILTNKYTLTNIDRCQFRLATDDTQIKLQGSARIVDCDFEAISNNVWDIYNYNEALVPCEVVIRGCRFWGSAVDGQNVSMQLAGDQKWRIEGCEFIGQRDVGINCGSTLDAGASVQIVGNYWNQASGVVYAIEIEGGGTVAVEDNEFKELRSTSGYAIRCASGEPTRLIVARNDFSQDAAARSVSFAGTLPTEYSAQGNYGPSGGLGWQDVASAATVTLPPLGELFRITGTTGISSIASSWNGRRITLRFASTPTVTDGSNLKLAGNLAATADDTITLVCDGTNWFEVGRAIN